jgi:hypothetical protein
MSLPPIGELASTPVIAPYRGGGWFESIAAHHKPLWHDVQLTRDRNGSLAQRSGRSNAEVGGSSPPRPTTGRMKLENLHLQDQAISLVGTGARAAVWPNCRGYGWLKKIGQRRLMMRGGVAIRDPLFRQVVGETGWTAETCRGGFRTLHKP